jgi:hypothetical protein
VIPVEPNIKQLTPVACPTRAQTCAHLIKYVTFLNIIRRAAFRFNLSPIVWLGVFSFKELAVATRM